MMGRNVAIALLILWTTVVASQSAIADSMENTYILHCAGCHSMKGSGLPENGIPDFHESGRFVGSQDGREYLIQVPGVSQARLSDETVAELLNWILVRFSKSTLPADFVPFTTDEIHRYRPNKASDAVERRAELRKKLQF